MVGRTGRTNVGKKQNGGTLKRNKVVLIIPAMRVIGRIGKVRATKVAQTRKQRTGMIGKDKAKGVARAFLGTNITG